MIQTALDFAIEQGRKGMQRAQMKAENALPGFTGDAADCMLAALLRWGPLPGETLTDIAKLRGFVPADDRAFGSVFKRLLRDGAQVVGTCPRVKGHGSSGGKIYGLQSANDGIE